MLTKLFSVESLSLSYPYTCTEKPLKLNILTSFSHNYLFRFIFSIRFSMNICILSLRSICPRVCTRGSPPTRELNSRGNFIFPTKLFVPSTLLSFPLLRKLSLEERHDTRSYDVWVRQLAAGRTKWTRTTFISLSLTTFEKRRFRSKKGFVTA